MESCMLEAGRGDYWGSWAIVAATLVLPVVLGLCEWQSVRRSGYFLYEGLVARLRVNGWLLGGMGGIVGLVINRDTLARLQANYPTVCGTYDHLLGVCSWVSVLGIAASFAGSTLWFLRLFGAAPGPLKRLL